MKEYCIRYHALTMTIAEKHNEEHVDAAWRLRDLWQDRNSQSPNRRREINRLFEA